MPDTTTVSIDARGHTATLVVVRDSGAFSSPTLDTDAVARIRVDDAGNFERDLYMHFDKASAVTISTTTNANDTATYTVPLVGEDMAGTTGNPAYHDAFSGETSKHGSSFPSGVVSEGVFSSIGVVANTSVTNNSTVSKIAPTCIDITEPGQTIKDGNLIVEAFIEAGEGVDDTDVTAVFTDSGATEHTVALSRYKLEPNSGYYSTLAPGVAALSIWRGTVDVSSAADGIGQLHIEARGLNGILADTSVDGDATTPQFIDNADAHTHYYAFVDERFTMDITGTFTLAKGNRLTGGTSGATAIVCEAVDNSGGGSASVALVRTDDPDTAFTASESLSGLASGSATVDDGVETPNGATEGTLSATEATARAAPFDGIGRAQERLASQRSTDLGGSNKNAGGCTIKILGPYCTKFGRTANGFGFASHDQRRQAIRIVGDEGDNTTCHMVGGGNSTSRDQSMFCTMLEDITIQALSSATADEVWNWSSGDDVLMMTKRCRFLGLGPSSAVGSQLRNVKETWHDHVEVEDFNGGYTDGPERNRINVVRWAKVDGKESDASQTVGQSHGYSFFLGRTNDLRGSGAGTHGDVVQWTGNVENVAAIVFADENSYQGIFSNNSDSNDLLTRAYIKAFVKQVNDGDIGSFVIAINQSVNGLIVDFTTAIAPTATVGSEAGKAASINIIHDSVGRSDNVWIRNSVFEGWGAQIWNEDGNSDAPWGASCAVNCHVHQGTARGVRSTSSDDTGDSLSDLYVGPWTNGGESPGNDDTDWSSKRSGTLDNRLLARDLIGTHYDFISGDAFAAGGAIGSMLEPAPVAPDPVTPGYLRRTAGLVFDVTIESGANADVDTKGDATFEVSHNTTGPVTKRALLRFNRPSRMRPGRDIESATLTLNFSSGAGVDDANLIFAAIEGEGVSADATWNRKDGSSQWAASNGGGDYANVSGSTLVSPAKNGSGEVEYDIKDVVQKAISLNPRSRFIDILVRLEDEASNESVTINGFADDGTTPDGQAPTLEITFENPNPPVIRGTVQGRVTGVSRVRLQGVRRPR